MAFMLFDATTRTFSRHRSRGHVRRNWRKQAGNFTNEQSSTRSSRRLPTSHLLLYTICSSTYGLHSKVPGNRPSYQTGTHQGITPALCAPASCQHRTSQMEGIARQPLRVLIVSENFLPKVDGVTRTLARLLQHLQSLGHEALVLGPADAVYA